MTEKPAWWTTASEWCERTVENERQLLATVDAWQRCAESAKRESREVRLFCDRTRRRLLRLMGEDEAEAWEVLENRIAEMAARSKRDEAAPVGNSEGEHERHDDEHERHYDVWVRARRK